MIFCNKKGYKPYKDSQPLVYTPPSQLNYCKKLLLYCYNIALFYFSLFLNLLYFILNYLKWISWALFVLNKINFRNVFNFLKVQ